MTGFAFPEILLAMNNAAQAGDLEKAHKIYHTSSSPYITHHPFSKPFNLDLEESTQARGRRR